MKIKLIILFAFLSIYSLLISTTWCIKLDGTGDFTSIQEGIDASVDSDTVLVYPGTYVENVVIEDKTLTLASLELTTNNPQYITSTIIDGQSLSSCIYIDDCVNGITIQGFTITNGIGRCSNSSTRCGGGIMCSNSDILLVKNNINFNIATVGGGVYFSQSDIEIRANNIFSNSAGIGGGVYLNFQSTLLCDPVNKNSIFDNNAANGYDIFGSF